MGDRRLDSWKEIAEYLQRDVSTAIRWERRGLPIHRVPGATRQAVFAYPSEIDNWMAGRRAATDVPLAETPPEDEANRRRANDPKVSELGRRGRRRIPLAMGATLLVVAGLTRLLWAPSASGDGQIARVERRIKSIVALADDGAELWSFATEGRLQIPSGGPLQPEGMGIWVGDLDGDGADEALVSAALADGPQVGRDTLYCFSHRGRVLWQRQLDDVWRFAGGAYGAPWNLGRVAVVQVGGEARIVWIQNHHTWWPSVLAVLDGQGQRLSTFVHSGHFYAVAGMQAPTGPVILAAGISNYHAAAVLAVLDAHDAAGAGPEPEDSAYACLSCPAGAPTRYFVFPRSEFNVASGDPYNRVAVLRVISEEGFEVQTYEDRYQTALGAVYRFGRDFALLQAAFSDGRADQHRWHESRGSLRHSLADCPESSPPHPRRWMPGVGWTELKPGSVLPSQ